MFTLQHRHTLSLDAKLSAQLDRLLDLWERSTAPEGMTPGEEAAFARQSNDEAAALERAVRAADK